jgi:hypothetical protein
MAKTNVVRSVGQVERYAYALPLLKNPGDYVIVDRGVPRSVVMLCPDGCGDVITLNLDKRFGRAWGIYGDRKRLSMYPSIWRDNGCRAHFILWAGKILWCVKEDYSRPSVEHSLIQEVHRRLPLDSYVYYENLAIEANLNPWEVLWACDDLVAKGFASRGPQRTFKASKDSKKSEKRNGK